MPDKPLETILNRELEGGRARDVYGAQLACLEDVVNYGTNLIAACFHSSERSQTDVVLIAVITKHVVSMIDGVSELLRAACVQAASLQCRTALESSIYLDWIVKEDVDGRALHYFVWNIRREREWAQRVIPGHERHREFADTMGELAGVLSNAPIEDAERAAANLDGFLSKAPYAEVSANFDKVRGDRPYDPPWYAPLGARSIRQIADAVGRLPEYEVIYGSMSRAAHGSSMDDHVRFNSGRIEFEPIRWLKDFPWVFRTALSAAFHTYRVILSRYRPGQLDEFRRRYVAEWRQPYIEVPTVKYDVHFQPR